MRCSNCASSRRAEEAERSAKERSKTAARRLLAQFEQRAQGSIYLMLQNLHLFTDLFAADPLGGERAAHGDAKALKKQYHKLAAKLHPDRHTASAPLVQVQAEELFKMLGDAYAKEQARIASAGGGGPRRDDDLSV